MTIKTRLLLLLLGLPMLLLVIGATVMLMVEAERGEQRLRERLSLATDLIVPELASAVNRDDLPAMQALGGRLLNLPEVRAVGLRDADGTPLMERGRLQNGQSLPDQASRRLIANGRQWQLQMPLTPSPASPSEPIWLVVDVDALPLAVANYRRLASAGLGLLMLGLLLWLIAYTASQRLVGPLNAANQALRRLSSGKVPPRLAEPSTPELRKLSERVNALGEHLVQAREQMHRQVEQATAELQESMETIEVQNIELDLAHRRALDANRVKSEFMANMSHEIRTPLNGIVGFCRLLGRSRLEPRQREWLDHVQRACDNLLMLVNDVLDFSKLEAGRLELEHLPLDMVGLVDEVLGLQAPQAHQKRLALLGLVYDDVPTTLTGDPLRIRQVLTNLVNNAIKFTERGEVLVRVMVEQAEHGRVTLRISVSDTGIGMSLESRQGLFQAFHQAAPSHSRQFGGTGLGLTICRQLVEQMGGQIEVDSAPEQGSTFAFTLPLQGDEHLERPPELTLAGETVLLDEPHLATRHALRHLLTRWGARVIDAQTAAAEDYPASLLIAGLPHEPLNEGDIATWQRWLGAFSCPALLLINASPLDHPMPTLPHGGELLSKPVPRSALVEAVKRWLASDTAPPPLLLPRQPPPRKADKDAVRLLVVDDTESNRLLLRELIAQPGIDIELAASGEEALAMAQGQRYDLVLMDIRMPGMDGVETTRALRRLGGDWQELPIVAVTAHVLDAERQRLLANGLNDILVKPVDANRLAETLQRHLARPVDMLLGPPLEPLSDDEQELADVDMALGTQLAGGRETLARDLLARLAAWLPESELNIQDAIDHQDDEALLDAIHALNGACRYCGVPRLALLVETLETRLRSRGRTAVLPLLDELFASMASVMSWTTPHPSSTTNATAMSASSESDR
ncbi:ATP-binding protein [Halomonas korlensis]|uniref:histidine kinase n=1 Tax=Halomonas korlensis TaxID=463301 RepID=A0A1I7KBB4_9GAMM|nr:ATP-binding protein [Halomonas korlensis]SFU94675.1 two-component system, NarL family, sensor histidine kinase BarA [Halomonas korlensis]